MRALLLTLIWCACVTTFCCCCFASRCVCCRLHDSCVTATFFTSKCVRYRPDNVCLKMPSLSVWCYLHESRCVFFVAVCFETVRYRLCLCQYACVTGLLQVLCFFLNLSHNFSACFFSLCSRHRLQSECRSSQQHAAPAAGSHTEFHGHSAAPVRRHGPDDRTRFFVHHSGSHERGEQDRSTTHSNLEINSLLKNAK